eukprot:GHVR01184312.1.p2 GENE.GHVR01184312.1~~GHVR01184312.1.p2  ORF type:complete len:140 (-),score=31.98 GHVR01184312.1:226-645(-)
MTDSVDGELPHEKIEDESFDDIPSATRVAFKRALVVDGLVRGLHEVARVLSRKEAHMCFLAESCEEPAYKKLVTALCKEGKIPCVTVPDRKSLGEWAGLCKVEKDGTSRKVVGASCVCITDWGEYSNARTYLMENSVLA